MARKGSLGFFLFWFVEVGWEVEGVDCFLQTHYGGGGGDWFKKINIR
jgi:hypothetical protein